MVPVTAWALLLVDRVSLWPVAVLEERACELLLTAVEELLEERAWELLLTEELLPLERVVTPPEREVVLVLLVPLERVVVLLVPLERVALDELLERVACWLLLPLERLTCELLPLERVLEELEDRVVCWLLPLERVEEELEVERLPEELLPVERVVVEPPPERDWAGISGAVSMDSAITNKAA